MLKMTYVYYFIGVLFGGTAVLNAFERRWLRVAFWGVMTVPCLVGDQMLAAAKAGTAWPVQAMGVGVIALAVLASVMPPRPSRDEAAQAPAREASASRLGNRLFGPVLAIPVIVAALVIGAKPAGSPVLRAIDPAQLALVSFGIATVIALIAALLVTRSHPVRGLTEGSRLLDTLNWQAVLPLTLATLGVVFADTGVGKAIAALVAAVIPTQSALACLLAFGLGMVAFTAIMGNAFAAFPVMMSGIGLPLLIKVHGAQPAVLGAMGMLTGYCGTLLTPMAANFNIVPVLLLDLRDQYAVIRAQVPTALVLLIVQLVMMSLLVFP